MYKLFKYKKEDVLEKSINGEYKNQIYSVFNQSKNPVIERFNKTLTNKLWKQFTVQKNQKWLNILPKIIKDYNNKVHSTIGVSSVQASKDPSSIKVKEFRIPNMNEKQKLNFEDRVRIYRHKNQFGKGYKGYWTWFIKEIHGSFYSNELRITLF